MSRIPRLIKPLIWFAICLAVIGLVSGGLLSIVTGLTWLGNNGYWRINMLIASGIFFSGFLFGYYLFNNPDEGDNAFGFFIMLVCSALTTCFIWGALAW